MCEKMSKKEEMPHWISLVKTIHAMQDAVENGEPEHEIKGWITNILDLYDLREYEFKALAEAVLRGRLKTKKEV